VKVESNTQVRLKVDGKTFDKAKTEAALKDAGYGGSKVRS
jgi:hypothetical protein